MVANKEKSIVTPDDPDTDKDRDAENADENSTTEPVALPSRSESNGSDDIRDSLGRLEQMMAGVISRQNQMEADYQRPNRSADTRDATSRKSEERQLPQNVWTSRFHIPLDKIPHDKRYFWARETIHNEPDESNMEMMLMKGWQPVPADRHPELISPLLPGREHEKPKYIRRGGQILMEKPEALVRLSEEALRQENMAILNSVATLGNEQNEDAASHNMPYTVDVNSTSIERVTDFKE